MTCSPGRTNLYVMAGQSNAEGRANVSGLPEQYQFIPDNAEYWFNGVRRMSFLNAVFTGIWAFGAMPTLVHSVCAANPNEYHIFVQSTQGSTTLYAAWRPPLPDTARFVTTTELEATYQVHLLNNRVAQALGKRAACPKAFFWWQGEQDAATSEAVGNDYANGLSLLGGHIVSTIDNFDKFIIGRTRYTPQASDPGISAVRTAQDAAVTAKPGGMTTVALDFDALTLVDGVHLDAAGYLAAGQAFAAAI